jgi:glycogen synthase
MKILVISNLYPPHYVGGYELRCQKVVDALRKRGHAVEVLTSNHGLSGAVQKPAEAGIQRELRIHGFFGHPWLGIGPLRELEFHNNQAVRKAVERFRPDVIHVWNLGGISKSIIFTLARLGLPTVYDISDHWIARSLVGDVWLRWWNRPDAPLRHRILRAAWTALGKRRTWGEIAPTNPVESLRFPRMYFCSQALRDLTVAAGYPVGHGTVIYCPVDTQRFNGTPVPAERPLKKLLYVGRLAEDKGVMTALKAMREVKGRFGGALYVYGKGDADYTRLLTEYVTEHQLPVHFASASAAEMPAVYQNHDALVFTSEWEEPFALTPLEAMASGLPVIGTTTGGSRELLRHEQNALTYPAGEATRLAEQILRLDSDPTLRASLAKAGHAEIGRYAEPVIVGQIETYLEETRRDWKTILARESTGR